MPVHLEDGLFRLCEDLIAQDENFRSQALNRNFKNIDSELFGEYRLYRLKQTVKYAYENSRFYKRLFNEKGVRPGDIQRMADLAKLPFTEPKDLVGSSYDFLCISQSQVEKPVTFFSSGTTGIQKRIFFSNRDIENIRLFLSVGMNTVTDRDGIIQVLLPNANGRGIGTMLAMALNEFGMQAYATDMMLESAEQVRYTLEKKATVWFGDTGTIYRITKEMENKADLSSLGLKILFLTMRHPSPVMVKHLEETWDCRVYTHYGLTEMGWGLAVDCEQGDGFHYNELGVIAEVIDPHTGGLLPDGAEGELVFTSLGRTAMPLIRYRSHDFATLTNKRCGCGHGLQTMGHVLRRSEAVVKLAEDAEIYPTMFDDVLYSFDVVVEYNIFLDKKGKLPVLVFDVEVLQQYDGLAEEIVARVGSMPVIRKHMGQPRVKLLPPGALKPSCYEKKLIKEAK